MIKKSIHTFLYLFTSICFIYGQQIVTDNSQQPQQLIQNLVGDNCASASNISSQVNGSINNIISYGTFDRGSSNFPLQNGIVLSTGNVTNAGNAIINENLSDGDIQWTTDSDVLDILGIDQTLNATSIEFDFVTANNFVAFKYLFASDEYQQEYPCNFRDVFAILIKRAGTADPYTNIALVPDTTTEISTNTVHPNINGFCEAQNEDYFQGYNQGSTNFNGQTTVLIANSDVIPGETYHIKFIIADHIDERFDSAVFIEAEGFGGSIDLGPDQTICGNNLTLDAEIDNPFANYDWFFNDVQIPGENNPTLDANQSGIYRVEISIPGSGGNCILEDSIEIEIIPFQPAAPIDDILICDTPPSDGIFDFDFPLLKNDEIFAELTSNNYLISYHLSQEDAENNTNPIVGIYQNTEAEETIYVRIESLDGSCLQIGSFSYTIDISPNTQDYTIEICNGNIADPGLSNLNIFNNILANGELNRTVTYYLNEDDAANNINPITDFPDFSLQPPNIVAKIEITDNPSSCFSLAYLNFNYISPPELFTNTLILDACIDPDYEVTEDGVDYNYDTLPVFFDLEEYFEIIETSIFPGSSVRVVALLGLGNPRSYTLTEQSTFTIPLGVSFDNGNCYSPVTLRLYKNYLYELIGFDKTINKCDDESNDGIAEFNFNEIKQDLLEDIDPDYSADVFIEYYESELDRTNGLNAIDQSAPFTVNNYDELYIEAYYVFNGIEACSIDSKINLNVNPALNLNPFSIEYCGNTDPNTNTTNVILQSISNTIIDEITNTLNIEVDIAYFENPEDAENQENEIINIYNLSPNQDLFIRVTNTSTDCYDVTSVEINISTALEAIIPEPIIICDEYQNLQTTVNLENIIDDLGITTNNVEFTFHETFENAQNDFFLPIGNINSYPTTTREIYLRAELEDESCFTIFNIEIFVYADPQLGEPTDMINCEINPNNPSEFLFEDKDLQIINNQLGMQVLYFETEAEAFDRENPIDKTVPYQNISNPQTIYVRLENTSGNSCFKVAPMQIEVRETPDYNVPTDVFECDINNTGLATTDLNNKISEIELGSTTNLNITFHLTPLNAEFGTNTIPLNYTVTSNPQLIYARIENANTECYNVETFNINTFSLPEVNFGQSLVACGNNFNTTLEWNLTDIELEILDGRQYNVDFTYYNTLVDAETNNNLIANPTAYTNTNSPETIYVRVRNATTDCFTVVPFELNINPAPSINDFGIYEVCDTEDNTIDLLEITEVLLDNTFNVLVSYHSNIADAEANQNSLNVNYTYTNALEDLVARVEFSTTGCYSVYPFQLMVNPLPIANQPSDLMACDDDFDGLLEFDLSVQNAAILNGQNPDEHTVSYFNSEDNATDNFDDLDNNYIAFDNEIIFVRLENNITGCFDITQFSVIINPLPNINIEDQTLCLNDLPIVVSAQTGNPLDTYLWSTNATTSEIEITTVGTYSVTITNQFGCENTSTFNVTESESAVIDVVETIDFSNPNNITITVTGIGNYLYQLNNLPFQSSNVFINVPIGYNTVTIIDQNGCARVTHEVLVIDTPKHMTPNGDGDFDTWHITGIETLPGTIVHIFSRYGKLLKELGHNSSGWDGTFNGNEMPADDYWYVANVIQNGKSFQVKGHFALRR